MVDSNDDTSKIVLLKIERVFLFEVLVASVCTTPLKTVERAGCRWTPSERSARGWYTLLSTSSRPLENTQASSQHCFCIFQFQPVLTPISQFSSVAQSCPTLCNPMDCSTSGSPVRHQLLELTQIHVHQVSDAIQASHPLLSPFPPTSIFPASGSFPVSQFFTSGGQSIRASASASVLPMSIQDWFSLGWSGWISLQSKGLSRVFSNTTVQKHQFFGAQL